MKRIILLCLASLVALTVVQAQESTKQQPRTLILGGNLGLLISENSNDPLVSSVSVNGMFYRQPVGIKQRFFSLNPYLGSQVSDHWIVGGRGIFSISNNEFDFAGFFNSTTGVFELVKQNRRTTTFGIGAFARYTVNPDKKVGLFIQNAIDYTAGTERLEVDNIEEGKEKYNSVELTVTPGVNWKISDNFSFF